MDQKKNEEIKLKRKGSALLLTTILLFVILSMVVSLTYVTVMEQKMSQKTKSSVGAFYTSESGIEWVLNKIAGATGTAPTISSTFSAQWDGTKANCPFGDCSVYLLKSDGTVVTDGSTLISDIKAVRSVGNQGGDTQRAIEAAVAAGLPAGMIAMFDAACPADWTRFSDLDGALVVGSSTYNKTAGTYTVGTGATTLNYANVIWCKKN